MKAELLQRNQGHGLYRRFQGMIATRALRRPDAQSASSGPNSPSDVNTITRRDMKTT